MKPFEKNPTGESPVRLKLQQAGQLRSNALRFGSDESVAVIRQGHGLLAGLLRCGRCGRKMHVRYWGKAAPPRSICCVGDFQNGGMYCIGFAGASVNRRFSELLLDVISPYGIEAQHPSGGECQFEIGQRVGHFHKQIQQLESDTPRRAGGLMSWAASKAVSA